jgi:hypothetical protein
MQISEIRPTKHSTDSSYLTLGVLRRATSTAAFVLVLVALWLLTHRYRGFAGDAKLYAIQALARIHPGLTHDLYLQNVSQDQFTIFSPLYAWCIELVGLPYAETALTIVFKVWLLAAAWSLARELSSSRVAFLAAASLIIMPAGYGAGQVFQYAEDWLTARSLAEALVITSLALHFRGFRVTGLLIAVGALFVHPLMALPGVLLLMCLWVPSRIGLLGAGAGILVSLVIALGAVLLPSAARVFTVMDADWFEVTRERSIFLFLQFWSVDDWKLNVRPFITLTISVLAVSDPRIRRLGLAAMLVGATGLVVALIAGLIGPVAIMIQGQAWRWVWVTGFIAVLLLVPSVARVWRDDRCGPICAMLLIGGWTFAAVDGVLCLALSLLFWLMRDRLTARVAHYLRWAAAALCAVIVIWVIANCWSISSVAHLVSGREPFAITSIKNFMELDMVSPLLVASLTYWIGRSKSAAAPAAISAALVALSVLAAPGAFKAVGQIGATATTAEFSDWREAIPADSNVLVVPSPSSAAFAWFTLERPSYLSEDQSSGVVFSRQTELEVRRRSEAVLPVWDTNWKSWSAAHRHQSGSTMYDSQSRPLTRDGLIKMCRDAQLNFVVAKENVGFDPMQHTHIGDWKDWNLYDCRRVNSMITPE